jgi:hypothetical protein
MFTAYFDGSGKRESKVVTVAGYIANSATWQKIEIEWRRALCDFNLEQLHMSKLKPAQHSRKLLGRFANILVTWAEVGIASSVLSAAFAEELSSLNTQAFREPFCVAAPFAIAAAEAWAQRRSYEGPLAFVFEDGDRKHEFVKAYDSAYRYFPKQLRSLAFAQKDVLPLQTADMLSYLVRHEISFTCEEKAAPDDWRAYALRQLNKGIVDSRWFSNEQLKLFDEKWYEILKNEPGALKRQLGDRINQGKRKR